MVTAAAKKLPPDNYALGRKALPPRAPSPGGNKKTKVKKMTQAERFILGLIRRKTNFRTSP
jgi:hypothetical protein